MGNHFGRRRYGLEGGERSSDMVFAQCCRVLRQYVSVDVVRLVRDGAVCLEFRCTFCPEDELNESA